MELGKSNITWVGCWWDLGRDPQPYRNSISSILKLPINIVVFVQIGQSRVITQITPVESPPLARIKLVELDQLPLNFPLDEVTQKYQANRNPHFNPSKDTPLYCLLQSNKLALMELAIKENYFNTNYIGWLDLGLGRLTDLSSLVRLDSWVKTKSSSLKQQVRFCLIKTTGLTIKSSRDLFYKLAHGYIVSGIFLGSTQSIINLAQLFNKEVTTCYQQGIITLEEKILMYLYTKYPRLFSFHFGDYADCLINWVGGINNVNFLVYFLQRENSHLLAVKRLKHIWRGALTTGDFSMYNKYAATSHSLFHRAILNYTEPFDTIVKQVKAFELIREGIQSNYLICRHISAIIMMVDYPDGYLLSLTRTMSIKYRVIWIVKRHLSDLDFTTIAQLSDYRRDQSDLILNPSYYHITNYRLINWNLINQFCHKYINLLIYNPLDHPLGLNRDYRLIKCHNLCLDYNQLANDDKIV